jgi:single-strand DNA-binding protein
MINQVILVGRLTADPEKQELKSDKTKVRFTLAVNRPYKDEQGNSVADFIPVVCWNGTAENVLKYCTKGFLVGVEGSLHARKYETESGAKRTTYEVSANRVVFLERKKDVKEEDEDPFA